MYVCVCKAITDAQIREAIDDGVDNRKKLSHCLGVGTECGKCTRHVQELITESKQTTSVSPIFAQPAFIPVNI